MSFIRSRQKSPPSEIYLAVVEVTLEDDEVGLGEVQEQIRGCARERSAILIRPLWRK